MSKNRTQEIVEEIDNLLQDALVNANVYTSHEKVRPSAVRAFDKVEEARMLLDQIDERDFRDGSGDFDSETGSDAAWEKHRQEIVEKYGIEDTNGENQKTELPS